MTEFRTISSEDWKQAFKRAREEPNNIRKKIMQQPFNQLTPAQAERLDILAEECAEVIKAVCKIKRHGYESFNPFDETKKTNRNHLMEEIGNVDSAIQMLSDAGEISLSLIDIKAAEKFSTVRQYTHHQ